MSEAAKRKEKRKKKKHRGGQPLDILFNFFTLFYVGRRQSFVDCRFPSRCVRVVLFRFRYLILVEKL